MRILHVVEPFSSGITTFIVGLTSHLPDHEHIVLHGNRTTADEMDKVRKRFDARVSFLLWKNAQRSINPIKDSFAFWQLVKVLRSKKFDIIHLHSAKAGFLGRLAGRILNHKSIIYTPNSAPFARTDINSFQRKIFLILERLGSRLSGRIITCGASEQNLYSEHGMQSIYINNGVEVLAAKKQWDSNRKKICIGFAGILTEQKAPALFSEIAFVFAENTRVVFKWIGDGPLRHELKAVNIELTGWLEDEQQVREELKDIDIILSTSQWEGQPFAVIEAMRDSKCLLLYDCVGNRDLVVQGENGFLFKTKEEAVEAIEYLLKDPALISRLGKKSHDLCLKNHDIIETTKQYNSEYKELAQTE